MTIATLPHKANPDIYGSGMALFKCRPVYFSIVINCTLTLPDNFTETEVVC